MKRISAIFILLVVLSVPSSAEKKKVAIAIGYGITMPSDSKTQDTFGNTWSGLSLETFEPSVPSSWRPKGVARAFRLNGPVSARLYPLTYGIERGFGEKASVRPFVQFQIGPYYGKIKDTTTGLNTSHVGLNTNVAVGVIIKRRFYVEARYDHFTPIAGYDFDGLSLSAGIRAVDIRL